MKLAEPEVKTYSRGIKGKKEYRVAQSAKVMDMFSNMLYKDKIGAVIRELSTNAWDAHKVAGTTDKVPVMTLPTPSSLEFRLRDFGTGLTEEQLDEIYTVYGESDKTHTNDLNGCMGIGSKSPFAYAKSFTTVSYLDGKKITVINAKDPITGIPNINTLDVSDTDEPNGLEIIISVRPKDVNEFQDKAERILRWFEVRFDVKGGYRSFSIQKNNYFIEDEVNGYWGLNKDSVYDGSYAIMGNVAYPIDGTQFFREEDNEDLDQRDSGRDWYQHYSRRFSKNSKEFKYAKMLDGNFEIRFDMGDVEMDISREGLQYTEKTKDAIRKRLDVITRDIGKIVSNKIQGAKSKFDAVSTYKQLLNAELRFISDFIDTDHISWKGIKIKDVKSSIPIRAVYNQKNVPDLPFKVTKFAKNRWRASIGRSDDVSYIEYGQNVKFFINDMKRGNYAAISRAYDLGHVDSNTIIYLVKPEEDKTLPIVVKKLIETVECDTTIIEYCSKVPLDPNAKTKNKVKRENVFLFSPKKYGYDKEMWDSTHKVDFKDGGLYVEVNSWRYSDNGKFLRASNIKEIKDKLESIGISVPEIIGVKTVSIKKYNKSDKWTDFSVWARKQLVNYINNSNIKNEYISRKTFSDFKHKGIFNAIEKYVLKELGGEHQELNDFISKLKEYKKENSVAKIDKVEELCNLLGEKLDIDLDNKVNLNKEAKDILEKYPVFSLVSEWDLHNGDKSKAVVEICDLVYSSKKDLK